MKLLLAIVLAAGCGHKTPAAPMPAPTTAPVDAAPLDGSTTGSDTTPMPPDVPR